MIRVSTLNGRAFAFGLDWQAHHASGLATWWAERRRRAGKQARVYCRLKGLVGAGDAPAPTKGKLYSYAATLAGSAEDGVYVASVGETEWWIGVVSGGHVAPGTDLIVPATQARERVAGLSATLDLPVFAAPGVSLSVNIQPWQPESVAEASHPVPLQQIVHHSPVLPVAAVAVLVALGAGVAGLHHHAKAKSQAAAKAKQRKARELNGYRTAVRGALRQYPVDPDWPQAAWRRLTHAPAYLAGWTLSQASCKLTGCTLTYVLHGANDYAISPFRQRFKHVQVDRSGKKIRVTLAHPVRHVTAIGPYLHGAASVRGGLALEDWRGLTRLHVPGISKAPSVLVSDLGRSHDASSLHLADVSHTQVRLSGKYLPLPALRASIAWGKAARLRVASFTWKPGLAGPGGWSIVLTGLRN